MTKSKTPAAKKRAPKSKGEFVTKITKPGLYLGMRDVDYHADPCPEPSASASFLGVIHESSPAHARLTHPRLNPNFKAKESTAGMDFGSAYHTLLLDSGKVVVVEARDWRTDAAKDKRREVRSLGATPILVADWHRAQAMAKELRAELQRKDSPLPDIFDPKFGGQSEVTAVWRESDVWCRARADRWIPPGRMPGAPNGLIADIKTTGELATADVWERKLYALKSDFASVWYPAGFVMASNQGGANLTKLPRFVFIVQEDQEPFAHTILELDDVAREHTTGKIANAFGQFVAAMTSGEWPKYPRAIRSVLPPVWEANAEARRHLAADLMNRGV